jgi:hypothetical protein
LRISSIAPVTSSTAAPVDRVTWYDSSRRVRAVEANEAARSAAFQHTLERLQEHPHRRRMKVIEVVFARGIRPGLVKLEHVK